MQEWLCRQQRLLVLWPGGRSRHKKAEQNYAMQPPICIPRFQHVHKSRHLRWRELNLTVNERAAYLLSSFLSSAERCTTTFMKILHLTKLDAILIL
jgi:hypothetical protein